MATLRNGRPRGRPRLDKFGGTVKHVTITVRPTVLEEAKRRSSELGITLSAFADRALARECQVAIPAYRQTLPAAFPAVPFGSVYRYDESFVTQCPNCNAAADDGYQCRNQFGAACYRCNTFYNQNPAGDWETFNPRQYD